MTQRPRTELGFVKLSDSDLVLEDPEQDVRGKDVYDVYGEQIGSVEDLYIGRQERKVRFLEVGTGGFLGMGEKHFLVPVEAVTEIGDSRVTIASGGEEVAGSPPFDTKVVPPTAGHQRTSMTTTALDLGPSGVAPRDRYSEGGMGRW